MRRRPAAAPLRRAAWERALVPGDLVAQAFPASAPLFGAAVVVVPFAVAAAAVVVPVAVPVVVAAAVVVPVVVVAAVALTVS